MTKKRRDEFASGQKWETALGSVVTILDVFPVGFDGTLFIRYVYKDGSEFTRNAGDTKRWVKVDG